MTNGPRRSAPQAKGDLGGDVDMYFVNHHMELRYKIMKPGMWVAREEENNNNYLVVLSCKDDLTATLWYADLKPSELRDVINDQKRSCEDFQNDVNNYETRDRYDPYQSAAYTLYYNNCNKIGNNSMITANSAEAAAEAEEEECQRSSVMISCLEWCMSGALVTVPAGSDPSIAAAQLFVNTTTTIDEDPETDGPKTTFHHCETGLRLEYPVTPGAAAPDEYEIRKLCLCPTCKEPEHPEPEGEG